MARCSSGTSGGPRACGGGPWTASGSCTRTAWSPRVRGWSLERATAGYNVGVVPARAGVVPRPACCATRKDCGPRACGGGPMFGSGWDTLKGWSPSVRGWSLPAQGFDDQGSVVPARAGVVPSSRVSSISAQAWSPRVRGWSPRGQGRVAVYWWSPRVRGWSGRLGPAMSVPVVVPARAGVVPSAARSGPGTPCGPRACGGGPCCGANSRRTRVWSPRVRGWSLLWSELPQDSGVVPARAGVAPRPVAARPSPTGAPCACGDCSEVGDGWSATERGEAAVAVVPARAGKSATHGGGAAEVTLSGVHRGAAQASCLDHLVRVTQPGSLLAVGHRQSELRRRGLGDGPRLAGGRAAVLAATGLPGSGHRGTPSRAVDHRRTSRHVAPSRLAVGQATPARQVAQNSV